MFKSYQSGPVVEVLSAKDRPLRGQFSDKGNHQVYNKAVKGYVLEFESAALSFSVPSDSSKTLGLTQSYLLLQIYLPASQHFSLELVVTDQALVKRRFLLSSATRDTAVSALHVRTPNKTIRRGEWLNLSVDLPSYLTGSFPAAVFRSLDGIVLTGFCKVRRIFTMRSPIWSQEMTSEDWEPVPKNLEFPPGVRFESQFLQFQQVSIEPLMEVRVVQKNKPKTAFGTRVSAEPKMRKSPQQVLQFSRPTVSQQMSGSSARSSRYDLHSRKEEERPEESDYNPWVSQVKLPSKIVPEMRSLTSSTGNQTASVPKLVFSYDNPLDLIETVHSTDFRTSTKFLNPLEDGDIDSTPISTVLPPPVFPQEYRLEEYTGKEESSGSEEEIELAFDPVLGCYYDPQTHEYYEVKK